MADQAAATAPVATAAPVAASAAPSLTPEAAAQLAAQVGPDVKQTLANKALPELRNAAAAAAEAEAAAVRREGESNAAKANSVLGEEQKLLEEQEALRVQQEADKARLEADKAKAIEAARKLREEAASDYERGFFETRGTAAKWAAAIGTGLGAFAATWNGTPNFALQTLDRLMDEHNKLEHARLVQKRESAKAAGEEVGRIDEAIKNYWTITAPQQQAALLKRAEQRRKVELARYGADEATIAQDKILAGIQEKRVQRETELEKALGAKVEIDNSAQNKAKRDAIKAQAAGGDTPLDKLTEGERKTLATLNAAMTNIKRAGQSEFTTQDRAVMNNLTAAMRNVAPSEPGKFWSNVEQLTGSYYKQLSPAGREKFDAIYQAAQNLERTPSGGVIGPHEIAGLISQASKPGGTKALVQQARDFAIASGRSNEVNKSIDAVEKELATPMSSRDLAQRRAEAASLLRTTKDPDDRAALEYIIKNPGDSLAPSALQRIRGN